MTKGGGLLPVGKRGAWLAAILLVMLGALPTPGAARADEGGYGDEDKVILLDSGERGGGKGGKGSPLWPLWSRQLRRFYAVREFGLSASGRMGDEAAYRLTPAALHGVDLFILTGFGSGGVMGEAGGGRREIDYRLSPAELATLEAFVREGGTLLVIPTWVGDEDPLTPLLARFGLDYRPADRLVLDEHATGRVASAGLDLTARLAGRSYTLRADGWLHRLNGLPAGGAMTIAEAGGKPAVAAVAAGAGTVVFLGTASLVNSRWGPATTSTFAADNIPFLFDLLAYATGATPLTAAEARQVAWEVRVTALEGAFYFDTYYNGAARSPNQPSEFVWGRRLLDAVATGRRCDVGPGCVSWTATPEQRAVLDEAAAEEAALRGRFEGLEAALQVGPRRPPASPLARIASPEGLDYAAVEREYGVLVDGLAAHQQRRARFDDLYRQQGSTVVSLRQGGVLSLAGLGLAAGLLLVARRSLRRRAPFT